MIQYVDEQVRRSFCRSFSNVAAHLWPLHILIFPTLSIKYQLQFSSLPIACLYWLSLLFCLFFFWYFFYCTSILPSSGARLSKKVPIKTNNTSTLLIPQLFRPCLIFSFSFASESIYLKEKKKNKLILLFKAYVYLKWEEASSDNNVNLKKITSWPAVASKVLSRSLPVEIWQCKWWWAWQRKILSKSLRSQTVSLFPCLQIFNLQLTQC